MVVAASASQENYNECNHNVKVLQKHVSKIIFVVS